MAQIKITTRSLDALVARAKREGALLYAWDEMQRGFGARISPKGQVSWLVQKWQGGRGGKAQRLSFQANGIDAARKEAARLAGDVAKGIDLPTRKREARKAKREALNAPTVQVATALYVKRHRKPGRYWAELEQRFNNEIVPALGATTRLTEITKAELRNLIEAKQDAGHPRGAGLLYAAFNPFFKWCVARDLLERSPLDGVPSPKPSEARDRVLTDAELKTFWTATAADPLYGPFYKLLLLTMQRREEVAALQWSEIDGTLWTIPGERTKNGKAHLVPLSPQAMAVIATIPRIDGCPYLFPVTGRDGLWNSICAYGDAKERLDGVMQLATPWRVHDLRRTGRTNLAKLKVPREVAEKILNHVPKDKLEAVYNLHQYLEERTQAMSVWGLHVHRLTENFVPNNVVKFRV